MATPAQWLAGARPRTLPAALSPVIAGAGVAAWADAFSWWRTLLCLVVSLALQIGCNYANDYSDGIRGTDDVRVGPLRLTGSRAARPGAVKAAAFACFALAGVAGLVLAAVTAWWLVLVGVLCVLAAWFYTGGKRPYGYAGLGEVMVFVFFGLVAVVGTVYVQTQDWRWGGLWGGVGVGALTTALLVANNLRDIPTDALAGKNTLAVRLGDPASRRLYVALVLLAVVAVVGVAATTSWVALIGLLFLAVAAQGMRTVATARNTGPALIPALQQTGVADLAWALCVGVPLFFA
ncbi:1,4-dihydroxy-2-naphthoate polyprenyltransferase [Nocardioides sp. DS6]|uniref:1,4-dihydroxy-2-naphthoate octaprenyltransferase n=1 Tax=Nocardioides eburneus TaxID=3231482 RepID=A0ABV3SUT0_9ACTN